MSTSGFYAWKHRPEAARAAADRRIGVLVREAHQRSRQTYGSPRVHADLRAQGERVSRKRVARVMRELGLRGRSRCRFVRTTDSKAGEAAAENLLARDFTATKPNERWVGDVTYLRTPHVRSEDGRHTLELYTFARAIRSLAPRAPRKRDQSVQRTLQLSPSGLKLDLDKANGRRVGHLLSP